MILMRSYNGFYLHCCNDISRNLFNTKKIVFTVFYKNPLNFEVMFYVKILKVKLSISLHLCLFGSKYNPCSNNTQMFHLSKVI